MIRLIILLGLCTLLPLKAAIAADSLKVYAAASMTNVISDLAKSYSDETGIRIVTVFAGSSSLARQIESGAPADLYISANKKWVDYLLAKGLISQEGIRVVAENELVLIAPQSHPQKSFDFTSTAVWNGLLLNERLAIGQPESVPAGIYAKQSLTNLAVWDTVKTKVAPTSSVRIALALVERGEATLGIVYKTDALMSEKVTIVDSFPNTLHEPIVYPMAIMNNDLVVKSFADFLVSDQAKQVFTRYGFK
ncbi:molybdate ABC transporter substrate-binding protein [Vibrio sp. F74]|uniref:molybdate ABC transporter substrate-binding protein n=1 Tax=Vibrio sp. F74 TaxID=700020 RepID=UPI0035F57E69